MKNKFLSSFKSKIRLKITGKHIERFLKKIVSSRIELLNIKNGKKNTAYIWIYKHDYVKICSLKTIYDITVVDASGWIKIKKTFLINRFLLFFMVLGIGFLFVLTNIIFEIEVVYNNQEVRDFITTELKKYGIEKYKFKKSFEDLQSIKKQITTNYKDKIEWLEIETEGVKYIVRLQLREFADVKGENKSRDLVASKDATIKKIIAKNGQVIKTVNSYVKKGDTIVSGAITLNDETKGYVAAEGQVFGEVWYQMTVEYPFTYYEEKYTGRKKNVVSLKFINWSWDFFSLDKFKEKKVEEKVLFQNSLLPLKLVYEKQKEVEVIDQILTEEETIDHAIALARDKMEKELTDSEYIISQKNLKINVKESKIVLEVFFIVYEDITDYKDINVLENEIG